MESPLTTNKCRSFKMKNARKRNIRIHSLLSTTPFGKKIKISGNRRTLREGFISKSKAYSHPMIKRMVLEAQAMSRLTHEELEPKISNTMQENVFQTFGRTRSQTARHALLPGLDYTASENISVQRATNLYNELVSECVEDVDDYIELCKRGRKIEKISAHLKASSRSGRHRNAIGTSLTSISTPPVSRTPDMNYLQDKVNEEWVYYLAEQLS